MMQARQNATFNLQRLNHHLSRPWITPMTYLLDIQHDATI